MGCLVVILVGFGLVVLIGSFLPDPPKDTAPTPSASVVVSAPAPQPKVPVPVEAEPEKPPERDYCRLNSPRHGTLFYATRENAALGDEGRGFHVPGVYRFLCGQAEGGAVEVVFLDGSARTAFVPATTVWERKWAPYRRGCMAMGHDLYASAEHARRKELPLQFYGPADCDVLTDLPDVTR